MTGIILQWHLQFNQNILWTAIVAAIVIVIVFFFASFFTIYKFSAINGLGANVLFISLGCLFVWQKDIRNNKHWFGNKYREGDNILITLSENTTEKTRSYKANATVNFILKNDSCIRTTGTIILYFKKDSIIPGVNYGSRLIISKPLQEIRNSGNPGGFDYKRYSLFQGVTHQVFLKNNEFEILSAVSKDPFHEFLNTSRSKVLTILRKNIKGEKELGLAEALLIGYKDDLDKTLVQSYSNTGVVHVIAISGLHLGLIYWLLTSICKPFSKRRNLKWLRLILILAGLWMFSLLAGAQPSVIRSAVMFTCIVLGESLTRKSSIFNTLALSAFLLLCINPYWLWDVGFQLSYAAVLSIIIFVKPVYNWLYVKNRILDFFWKLNAVTIAAQILTVPISIYHFHQFPLSFLLTNLLAVPLSSLIVLGEILLCMVAFIPLAASIVGTILSWMIWLMNSYIERIEQLPFSLLDSLQVSIPQTVLLLAVAAGISIWLMEKTKNGLKFGLAALLAFFVLRSISFIKTNNRQQLIVYNVPQKQAIDFIDGRKYLFVGDSDLLADDFVRNFHLQPSRILHRIEPVTEFRNLQQDENFFTYKDKKILVINKTKQFQPVSDKIPIDLLVISGNPKLYFARLSKTFSVKQVVFDGSCPKWKINYWKRDCDSLHIPCYNVNEKGAFVMNLR